MDSIVFLDMSIDKQLCRQARQFALPEMVLFIRYVLISTPSVAFLECPGLHSDRRQFRVSSKRCRGVVSELVWHMIPRRVLNDLKAVRSPIFQRCYHSVVDPTYLSRLGVTLFVSNFNSDSESHPYDALEVESKL